MSDILSETVADRIIIKNLLKEIARLKGIIMSESRGKLLLDVNGDVYISHDYKLVGEAGIAERVEEAKEHIAEFEAAQELANKLKSATTEAPAQPEAEKAADAATAEVPATPAPAVPEGQPAAPAQPHPVVIQ